MKMILPALLALAIAMPALAGTREDVLSGAIRCGGIADDRAWLDCYYGAAQPMRAQLGLTPAPAAQTQLVPAGKAAPVPSPPAGEKNNGLLGDLFGGKLLAGNIRAAAIQFDKRGIFTITLADSEVWQQEQGDNSFADWREPPSHYIVTIRQGALGSANLKVQGDSKVYKVRRIR